MVAVLDRVMGEVEERLAQPSRIAERANVRSRALREALDRDLATLGDRRDALDAGGDHGLGIECLDRQDRGPGLDHRKVEQLVDELGQVVDLTLDLRREVPRRFGVVDGPGRQRLGQQLDRGEWRAQLVADVGHEVAPHALHPPKRRDVVKEENEAAGRQLDGVNDEMPGAEMPQVGLAGCGLVAREGLPRQRVERAPIRMRRSGSSRTVTRAGARPALRPRGRRGRRGATSSTRISRSPPRRDEEGLEGGGGGRVVHAGRGVKA